MILDGDNLLTIVAHVLFIIKIAASLGSISTHMCELFPTKTRYSGFSLSKKNIAVGFLAVLHYLYVQQSLRLQNKKLQQAFT
ncbi:MAG: hypothetical protein ACR5K2_01905 [Wolbachia sp.]